MKISRVCSVRNWLFEISRMRYHPATEAVCKIVSRLMSSLAVGTLPHVVFQWPLRTSEKRDSTPAVFLFRMSTIRVIHRVTSVLPPRDSILSSKAQSASPNVLCCRASTSSPLLLRASLACSLFRFLPPPLSLCSLNILLAL